MAGTSIALAACDASSTTAAPSALRTSASVVGTSSSTATFDAVHTALSRKGGIVRDDGNPLWALFGQSPIDLPLTNTTKLQSDDPMYAWAAFTPQVLAAPRSPDDPTNETLKIGPSVAGQGGTMTIRGTTYTLAQFHFHRPSEHIINGKRAAMEVHFVHTATVGADTKYAVVGVLMEEGAANEALESIWPGETQPAQVSQFDPRHLMPKTTTPYFTYGGSLTTGLTEPYLEGLNWIVYKQPITLSKAQLAHYAEAYEEENARSVQPLNGRTVFERVGGGRR